MASPLTRTVDPPPQFAHGTLLRWRRVGGLTLGEQRLAPHQRIAAQAGGAARFMLILRGGLIERRGTGSMAHTRQTLLFRRDGNQAYRASADGATFLVVEMDTGWRDRAARQAPVLSQPATFHGGFVLHLAQRLHGEFGLRDEVSRLAIESLALGVLAEASRRVARDAHPAVPAWLQQARAVVDSHIAERLALATVAALVGVHPVHLARTFRRTYNTTFAAYVRSARIEFARRELTASGAPLSQIAAAAGFCDQSHFCRLFKRHTGLSPQEYRLTACGA